MSLELERGAISRRYQAILVSDEEEAQVGRLAYILSHGCKENLVARPQDWPRVHCVTALLTGQPIEGTWFDRTKVGSASARRRGRRSAIHGNRGCEPRPLPCWRHFSAEHYRDRIAEMIEAITDQAAARRAATGTEPLGRLAILRQHPFSQPSKTKRSHAPLVHAASRRVRTQMRIACARFVRTFRASAEYLRAGDGLARFPRGSFPPGVPFVRVGRLAVTPVAWRQVFQSGRSVGLTIKQDVEAFKEQLQVAPGDPTDLFGEQ